MGATLVQIDRVMQCTLAVLDKYGELVAHRDFFHLLSLRKSRPGDARPGEEDERRRHE